MPGLFSQSGFFLQRRVQLTTKAVVLARCLLQLGLQLPLPGGSLFLEGAQLPVCGRARLLVFFRAVGELRTQVCELALQSGLSVCLFLQPGLQSGHVFFALGGCLLGSGQLSLQILSVCVRSLSGLAGLFPEPRQVLLQLRGVFRLLG